MANSQPVFILGGYQTDFARKWSREGLGLAEILAETAQGSLADAALDATQIEAGHVGNFIGELVSGQGHLGGLLAEADPAFAGLPMSRHEAACASGSMALMAAMADIESGRYDVVLVAGVEEMRSRPGGEVAQMLGAAARVPDEIDGVQYPWPHLFSEITEEYNRRYGLDPAHLAAIGQSNFTNARSNPNAHTRDWAWDEDFFSPDDPRNPVVSGWVRKQDCSQISDGGAGLILASRAFAERWASHRGLDLGSVPRITGWGHTSSRMGLMAKMADSRGDEGTGPAREHGAEGPGESLVFPHVRRAVLDAFGRAGVGSVAEIDLIETHDCFTITQYLAIDHFGITPPGRSFEAIEDGRVLSDGAIPINPSGGLMGVGHPVGATGVRMVLDAARQVEGRAGETQIPDARVAATLNIGGSTTTVASFVVARD